MLPCSHSGSSQCYRLITIATSARKHPEIIFLTHDHVACRRPVGRISCIASFSLYPSDEILATVWRPSSLPECACDQPVKKPLKYSAMARNLILATERTDSETLSFPH